ncbi:hypothetical protein V6N12_058813 [Hibiscus sabdariffa]|uniref:ABC transporter C family member 5 n=1 Tax=Hibiscus sabdariffa TaxID=183260 RepID=A0ABR2ET96_9ROSI
MGFFTLLLNSITAGEPPHFSLVRAIQGLPILELSSICINLTLVLVFLFIISARQISVCAGRIRFYKDDSVPNSSPIRRSITVDGEGQQVLVGAGFKLSVFCCFYVLLVQVVVLGFDGFSLIREAVDGKVVDWSALALPSAQCLAWFVLSFSALHCKFKVSERFPLLLRVWWFVSFLICLCSLYVDGKSLLVNGSNYFSSHVVANFAATPALAFLCFVAIRGETGIEVCGNSDLQEPLLLEEEAGCLKVTPYSNAGLFSLVTLSWLNPLLSLGAKRPLELKDIPLLAPKDRAKSNYKVLNFNWEKLKAENQSEQPSLAWALWRGDSQDLWGSSSVRAVDAHTSSELFKEYIMTALASKTVVFVTHQVEFLPTADLILVLKEGRIIQAGKYDELLQAGTDFETLVSAHHEAIEAMDIPTHSSEDSDENLQLDGKTVLTKKSDFSGNNIDNLAKEVQDGASASDTKAIKEKKKAKRRKNQLVQEEERTDGDQAKVGPMVLLVVYMALAFGSSWFIFMRAVLVATFGLAAAQKLFINMLRSVFRAPMSFFDSTPAGRILNRVSIDQSVVDLDIPFRLGGFASTTIQLLGIVGVMTKVTWQVLLLVIPMAVACLWMQKYYMASSRELVRIVSIQKSPVINLFGESIAGAATIRGFGQEKRFMKRNLYLLDCFARPFFCSLAAIEWLCLRMELLSTFVFAFCMILLVSFPNGSIDPSMAGLAVTYGLNLNARQIPSEAPPVIENSRPPSSWPECGTIELHDIKVRYAENFPVVLHGVTCAFPGGKKIGIVGRTGRTIRGNLDPLEEHSDHDIWEALDKSQLGDIVREKDQKLDAPVLENGDNWSVGQRQLVSLGRALLKQARILVLDEATASVDTATDNLIQKIIRTEFMNCTVCTIAHRIPTVIDSDLVLVLSDGRVAEFDTPARLLEDKSSMFLKLVLGAEGPSKSEPAATASFSQHSANTMTKGKGKGKCADQAT